MNKSKLTQNIGNVLKNVAILGTGLALATGLSSCGKRYETNIGPDLPGEKVTRIEIIVKHEYAAPPAAQPPQEVPAAPVAPETFNAEPVYPEASMSIYFGPRIFDHRMSSRLRHLHGYSNGWENRTFENLDSRRNSGNMRAYTGNSRVYTAPFVPRTNGQFRTGGRNRQ